MFVVPSPPSTPPYISLSTLCPPHFSPNANLPHERADQFPSLGLCRQLKHSFSSELGFRNSALRGIKEKRKFARKEGENVASFFFFFLREDRYLFASRLTRIEWNFWIENYRTKRDKQWCEEARFLEKRWEGNVNSSTRVPLHPVRAKSISLFIRGKREMSLDCKFHVVRRFAH